MNNRTRLKLSIASGIILAFIAITSTFKGLETLGISAIAGMMTILTTYIWGETKRPSNKQQS